MSEKRGLFNKIIFIGISAILIFSPIARGAVRVWSITPVLFIAYLMIFLLLWKIVNRNTQYAIRNTSIDLPLIMFAAIATGSFIFSIYKHDSFYALLLLFAYIGIYYLIVNEFDRGMRNGLVWVIVCSGFGISLYGVFQYVGIFNHSWWFPPNFLSATYVNHNHFAGYLELVLPLTIGMAIKSRSESSPLRIFLTVAIVVMVAAFILTQSRGAWMSLAASFLITTMLLSGKIRSEKKNILIAFLFVFFVISLIYFGKDVVSERFGTISQIAEGQEASFSSRVKIWEGSIALIKRSPFVGTGIGTFICAFPRYRPEGLNVMANAAHNDYLQIACEMGIFAITVFVFMLFIVIRTAFKKESFSYVRIGCAAGLMSLALHGLVDFNFYIPANMLLFTVLAAIIMRERGKDAA